MGARTKAAWIIPSAGAVGCMLACQSHRSLSASRVRFFVRFRFFSPTAGLMSGRRPTGRRHHLFFRVTRLVGPTDRSPAGVIAPVPARHGHSFRRSERPRRHPNPVSRGKRAGEHIGDTAVGTAPPTLRL